MSSFAGVRLPTLAERAYDRGQAEGELENIEDAERQALDWGADFCRRHPEINRAAFAAGFGETLIESFHAARQAAFDQAGVTFPDQIEGEVEWRRERDRRLAALAQGGRR